MGLVVHAGDGSHTLSCTISWIVLQARQSRVTSFAWTLAEFSSSMMSDGDDCVANGRSSWAMPKERRVVGRDG
jgi:hypothetical protein